MELIDRTESSTEQPGQKKSFGYFKLCPLLVSGVWWFEMFFLLSEHFGRNCNQNCGKDQRYLSNLQKWKTNGSDGKLNRAAGKILSQFKMVFFHFLGVFFLLFQIPQIIVLCSTSKRRISINPLNFLLCRARGFSPEMELTHSSKSSQLFLEI